MLFAIGLGILLAGAILRFGSQIQVIAWSAGFIMQPLVAVFYPVSILPKGVQYVSNLIPITHIFEGMRQVMELGTFNVQGYITSIVGSLVLIVFAVIIYSKAFEYAKMRGKLVYAE